MRECPAPPWIHAVELAPVVLSVDEPNSGPESRTGCIGWMAEAVLEHVRGKEGWQCRKAARPS